jgi:hypothetical protein
MVTFLPALRLPVLHPILMAINHYYVAPSFLDFSSALN